MTKKFIGLHLVCLVAGVTACAPQTVNDERAVESQVDALEGAAVVPGATGVVEFTAFFPGGGSGGCTGTMIRENAIVTAAHCFKDGGSGSTAWSGSAFFVIYYHDPVAGRREVYNQTATWLAYPTYDGSQGVAAANSDIAVIVTTTPLHNTDYHDYVRIYTDDESQLGSPLTAFGAGIFNDAGDDDLNLRKSNYNVQDVTGSHIVVDQSDDVHVCHGDSGGPLIKYANRGGTSVPLLVADLAQLQGIDGVNCYETLWWIDDAFYSRINFAKLGWMEDHMGYICTAHIANLHYKRCFSLPFINDINGEGGLEQGLATAIYSVIHT